MFIINKYTKWYNAIIYKALRDLNRGGYTEKHHIIPKSLSGDNSTDNLVKLTAREHFICHWLLTKMTTGENKAKMVCALHRMRCINGQQQRYQTKITSRVFEHIRESLSNRMRELNTNRVRAPITEQARKNMSNAQKRRIVSENARKNMSLAQVGKKKSQETKEKIAKSKLGKIFTDEHKENMSNAQKGRIMSTEHKEKLSLSKIGKKRKPFSEETKKKMSESRLLAMAQKSK